MLDPLENSCLLMLLVKNKVSLSVDKFLPIFFVKVHVVEQLYYLLISISIFKKFVFQANFYSTTQYTLVFIDANIGINYC